MFMRDTLANRPDPGIEGRLYYDSTGGVLYRDSGSLWELCDLQNSIIDVNNLGKLPTVVAYNSTDITAVGDQTLTFDSDLFDDYNFHSTSSNTERLTLPYDGSYLFQCRVTWNESTLGVLRLQLRKNGSGSGYFAEAQHLPGNGNKSHEVNGLLISCTAGDYVECIAHGAGKDIVANGFSPYFIAMYIGGKVV